ncbi:hypothetical protein GCM10025794_13580 [Massilia kyonggiensis]
MRVRVAQRRTLLVGLRTICHRLAGTVHHWGFLYRNQIWTGVGTQGRLHEQEAQQRDNGAHKADSARIAHWTMTDSSHYKSASVVVLADAMERPLKYRTPFPTYRLERRHSVI